ncbi:RNA-guided endonuclease InsQ/TnpB family protein [Nonomuraea angiospora]|uniref:RNA-guided endonuclease InsQ/TnpB family protein n=1 Tax=Nonomuraea angiospora TaxID=46172 RepID=UPI0036CDD8BA
MCGTPPWSSAAPTAAGTRGSVTTNRPASSPKPSRNFRGFPRCPATAFSRHSSTWTRRVPGTARGRSAGNPRPGRGRRSGSPRAPRSPSSGSTGAGHGPNSPSSAGSASASPAPLGGAVRNATVSRDGAHWYVSFLVEDGTLTPQRHDNPGSAVGIDRGVAKVVARSDGIFHHQVFAREREVGHAATLQRRLARTQKGSARRRHAAAKLGKALAKVRRRRADFAAKIAHTLTVGFELIVFEALATKNMTAGVAPKPDPGQQGAFLPNGAASKSGLNRSILDKGWHRIELATRSKARYTGTCVITVNPAYTSQTCNVCTVVDRKSRESQAVFRCTSCGHTEHADVNAAKNILTTGRAEHARPRPGVRAGARKPRNRVGRKANRQATAAQGHATASPELAGIPRP